MMRVTRLLPLLAIVVITQLALFPHLRIAGAVPDLALIVAVAVAWHDGTEFGAWIGFCCGLFLDFFVTTPYAMTALAYGVTAYFAASLSGAADRRVPALVVLATVGAGVCSGTVFVVGSILAGADQLQRAHSVSTLIIAALYDGVLAVPVFALVRVVAGDPQSARL